MTQAEGNALLCTQVSQPIPGEHAFDRDDETRTVGSDSLETRFRSGLHITVQRGLTIVAQDTDIHGTRMQVDPAVKLVWVGVEALEILCRGTRHTRAAGVKLLQTFAT